MADGAVLIDVGMNVSKAERELEKLKQKIIKTEQEVGKGTETQSGLKQEIAEVSAKLDEATEKVRTLKDEYSRSRGSTRAEIKTQLADALEEQRLLTSESNRLNREYDTVSRSIAKGTTSLTEMKEQAGAIERSLEGQRSGGNALSQMAVGAEAVSAAMKRGVKSILKWGFGIRSAFILMRRLRSAIVEGVKAFAEQDEETKANINGLKSALSTLKVSWGAAFAPILNAVAPILQKLIGMLISAANAVQALFAILGGKGSYKKAVAANDALAKSYGGAGSAAKEAKKEILGFDEINKLNDNESGGGGGGGGGASSLDYIEEQIDKASFLSKLAFSMKDVLFDWSDLTPEQIAEKAIAGLTSLGGAIIGGMVGGVPGVIIGALAGLAFGIVLDATTFNHDGKLDAEEIAKIINMGLLAATGGAIGFTLGGPLGAAIGVEAGLGIAVQLNKTLFNDDGELDTTELIRLIGEAFSAVAGGIFGFTLGGPVGALIGAAVGLSLAVVTMHLENALFNGNGTLDSNELFNIIGTAVAMIGGGIFGLVIGGPLGAAIGGTIGLLLAFGAVEIDKNGKVSAALIKFGEDAIDWLWQGFEDFTTTLQLIIGDPLKQFIEEEIPETAKWFLDMGKGMISGMIDGVGEKWRELKSFMSRKWDGLKEWWESLSLGAFDFKTPHLSVTWEDLPGNSILAQFLGFTSIPHLSIQWYARGGIVDGATLIGAGEAGKEAIVPLERHTEWINLVADRLIDRIVQSNRLADYISGLPMPALAMGQVVPPRSLNSSGSVFSDGDIERLVSGISAALTGGDSYGGEQSIKLYLDGRQIAETVTKHQRNMERGR